MTLRKMLPSCQRTPRRETPGLRTSRKKTLRHACVHCQGQRSACRLLHQSDLAGEPVDPTSVSRAGARGIAQFMPGTAAQFGVDDPFDPSQALPASARLLRQLQLKFGNLGLAAAAYNAGPGRVIDWLRKGKALPKETRSYVQIITGRPAESWRGSVQDAAFRLTPQLPCRDLPVFQDLDAAASPQSESAEEEPEPVKNIGIERSHRESITYGKKTRIRSAMTFRGRGGQHRSVRLASR